MATKKVQNLYADFVSKHPDTKDALNKFVEFVQEDNESQKKEELYVLGRHTDSGSTLFSRRVFYYKAVRLVADI